MVRAFPDVSEEVKSYLGLEGQREKMNSWRESSTPEQADAAGQLHRFYPNIPGEAVEAAVQEGITPNMQEAEWLEEASIESNRLPNGGKQVGENFNQADLDPDEVEGLDRGGLSPSRANQEGGQEDEDGFFDFLDPVTENLKTVTRNTLASADFLLDELDSVVTAAGVAASDDEQSFQDTLSDRRHSMLYYKMTEPDVDLGNGWMPGGDAWKRRQEERHNLQLDGEWMTPGRIAAHHAPFLEPEDTSYNIVSGAIDATFSIAADPVAYATLGASKGTQAARLFRNPQNHSALARAAGLLSGTTRKTDKQYAQAFIDGQPGNVMTEALSKVTEPREVYHLFRKRIDSKVATSIADETDPEGIRQILHANIGTSIPERPGSMAGRQLGKIHSQLTKDPTAKAFGFGAKLRQHPVMEHSRLWQWTPHQSVSPKSVEHSVEQADRFLHGADVDIATRNKRVREFMELEDGDWPGMFNAVKNMHSDVFRKLMRDDGFSEDQAKSFTRFFNKEIEDAQSYFGDEFGRPGFEAQEFFRVIEEGGEIPETFSKHGVHLISEMINKDIPLADMRELRQASGPVGRLLSQRDNFGLAGDAAHKAGRAIQTTNSVMTRAMSKVWKPLQLIRPAYAVRVGMENQLRMASNDYSSALKHPADFIKIAAKMSGRQKKRLTGDMFDETDEHLDQMQNMAEWRVKESGGAEFVPNGAFRIVGPEADEATRLRGWESEMQQLVKDPVAQKVANTGDLDETSRWLMNEGSKHRRALEKAWGHEIGPSEAREYASTVSRRIKAKTGGEPGQGASDELIGSIAAGKVPAKAGHSPDVNITKKTWGSLQNMLRRNNDRIPDYLKVEQRSLKERGVWDKFVDITGQQILAKPENYMARSPVLRQAYHDRLKQLMHDMTPEVQDSVLDHAKNVGKLSRKDRRELQRLARQGSGDRIQSIEEADALSLGYAVDETKRLLYDIRERAHISETMRYAAPFAEAWREILTTWGRTVRDYPHLARRGQQAVQGARTADPDQDGRGFFYEDPSTGEEMFAYPGGDLMTNAVWGAQEGTDMDLPGPLDAIGGAVEGVVSGDAPEEASIEPTGMVQGVNLIGQSGVLPGFGPTVQLPASYMIDDHPKYKWLRENVVFPFGEPRGDDPLEKATEAAVPAWMNKFRKWAMDSPESDRIYANSMMDIMKLKVKDGEHDFKSRDDQLQLLEDARESADRLWMVRGIAQSILPTGPTPRFSTEDVGGQGFDISAAATAYYEKQREVGQEKALEWFLTRFGPDSHLLVQPKSNSLVPRATDEPGADWERVNQGKLERFPTTASLFNPETDPNAEFDYDAYTQQFDEGVRQELTPDQFQALANQRLGRIAYQQARRRVEGSDFQAQRFLSMYRAKLAKEFPGYDAWTGEAQRPDAEQQIDELRSAVNDDVLGDTEAGKGLQEFFQIHDMATQEAQRRGYQTYENPKSTADVRQWVGKKAEEIISRYPDFMQIWDQVFSRRMEEDISEQIALGE